LREENSFCPSAPRAREEHEEAPACERSQEAFAYEVGLRRTYLGGVESSERNISIDKIARFAKALGVGTWEFVRDA
jgi:hypothetical protein